MLLRTRARQTRLRIEPSPWGDFHTLIVTTGAARSSSAICLMRSFSTKKPRRSGASFEVSHLQRLAGLSHPPWQNPYVERLIGTLRRDCLDHVLIFGERHLRQVLTLYSLYYNETRTHLGLSKDAPLRRAVQRSGTIVTTPILSGLHHRYARI